MAQRLLAGIERGVAAERVERLDRKRSARRLPMAPTTPSR
jgi:hypothetical protein